MSSCIKSLFCWSCQEVISSSSHSQVLLPVQRRAAGDPVTDQRPAVCAAPPEEVLRGHRQTGIHQGHGDHWHDQL